MIVLRFLRLIFFLLVSLTLFHSCSKDEEPKGAQGVYDVDPTFEPYVQEFI